LADLARAINIGPWFLTRCAVELPKCSLVKTDADALEILRLTPTSGFCEAKPLGVGKPNIELSKIPNVSPTGVY